MPNNNVVVSLRVGRSGVRECVLRDAGQKRAERSAYLRAEFSVVLSRPDDDHYNTVRAHRASDQTELQTLAGQTNARGRARRDQTDPVKKVNSENVRYVYFSTAGLWFSMLFTSIYVNLSG